MARPGAVPADGGVRLVQAGRHRPVPTDRHRAHDPGHMTKAMP